MGESDLHSDLSTFSDRPIVVMGAGGLGQKTVIGLRALGLEPAAFCDNNSALWDKSVQGLRVLSPTDAACSYGDDHLFVISIWHPSKAGMRPVVKQLAELGCRHIKAFAEIFLKRPETFLPHGIFEDAETWAQDREQIQAASQLFEGADRQEFLAQIRLRLEGDFSALNPPVPGMQYFPEDVVRLRDDEYFVECGAYNGDTLSDFLTASGGQFYKYLGCEPDPVSFAALKASTEDPRIDARQLAVGSVRGNVFFHASGTEGSKVHPDADMSVECVPLDELLVHENPTYIKMDVEGFEPEALLGAREVIQRCKPKLAICVYHQTRHLWELPLLMKQLQPQSKLHLRPHLADGWDLVCYSIPE